VSTATPHPRVVMAGAVPMSGLVAEVPDPRAVIVAIHGGGTSAAYFDCPGHPRLSLLRSAASLGFTAIALDRPGYGASGLYQDELMAPERRVELAFGAVDKIAPSGGRGAGVFLLAHSAGCELAMRMAIDDRGTDVLGIELTGTGLTLQPSAKAVLGQATTTRRPDGLRDLLWQPTNLYPPEVLTGGLSAPRAAYEVETTSNWAQRDFPALAARVRVPVEFSVAEHESVWDSSPEAIANIAALFTASPRVVVNEVAGGGHNLSVGLTADAYHQHVLSFVEECVIRCEGTDAEVEAG
jgi:pimeloyl-ACP methyl ester carboxylesterase